MLLHRSLTPRTVRVLESLLRWAESGLIDDRSMGMPMNHCEELVEFLRARRAAIQPEQVGLPLGRGRRSCGLRREEVALLAGVSVTWYTWLEQARRTNASHDVLIAIGRALRLDEAGLGHLLTLTEPGTATVQAPSALAVRH